MKAIYQPTGKAREYGDLACNLYRGCAHGCDYCYAPGVFRPRMTKKEFAITEEGRIHIDKNKRKSN